MNADTLPRQLRDLLDMLSYRRPAGSRSERKYRRRFLEPLGTVLDSARNMHATINMPDGTPSRVLWSSHTDTVHRIGGRQSLDWNGFKVRLHARETQSNCLGADDTTGNWIMRELIMARVPGHYVFHYDEESGGGGSRAVTMDEPERFEHARFAIAFDRAGTRDVVTHQIGGRTASDTCARSIADELARNGLSGYAPARGIFTDTAEYVDIVGECTNLSVGYEHAHSRHEYQDLRHAAYLLTAMLSFDESRIVASRQPGEYEPLPPIKVTSGGSSSSWWREYRTPGRPANAPIWWHANENDDDDERGGGSWKYNQDERDERERDTFTDWWRHSAVKRAREDDDDGYDYSRYEDTAVPLTKQDKAVLRSLGMVYRYARTH